MSTFSNSISLANRNYDACVQSLPELFGEGGFKSLRIALDWNVDRFVSFIRAALEIIASRNPRKLSTSHGELMLILATIDRESLWSEVEAITVFIHSMIKTSKWETIWQYLKDFGFVDSIVSKYNAQDDLLVRCGAFRGPGHIPIYVSCSWAVEEFKIFYPAGKYTLSVIRRID